MRGRILKAIWRNWLGKVRILFGALGLLLGTHADHGCTVSAQDSSPLKEIVSVDGSLAGLLRRASESIDPDRFVSVSAAKGEWIEAADDLKIAINGRSDPENFSNWMKYLDLDPLQTLLLDSGFEDDRKSISKAGREAIELGYRLVGRTAGLEIPAILLLRQKNERLINALRYRDPERASKQLSDRFAESAAKIEGLSPNPLPAELDPVTDTIKLLIATNQDPSLTSKIRSRFLSSNFRLSIGESVVQSFVNRGIQESRPVRDCILGTRIVGTATANGAVTANVLPAFGEARVEILLSSNVVSNNVGYNGPVKIRTMSRGSVQARRVLHITERSITADSTSTTADLDVDVVGVDHPIGLVRRIARNRIAKEKGKADRIAAERLQQQTKEQFDAETEQAAAFSPPDLMARLKPSLDRLDIPEPTRVLSSDDRSIILEGSFVDNDQLAAAVSPPASLGGGDVHVQIHESLVNNLIAPAIAGRTMTETQLRELIDSIRGSASEDPEAKADDDSPFEIDFARVRPLVFEARDGRLRMGVRGTRFKQGKRETKDALSICANYVPGRLDDGRMIFVRQGNVEVKFTGRERLTIPQAGIRGTMEKKFTKAFPDSILYRTIRLPSFENVPSLSGTEIRIVSLDLQNGWLTMGLQK